MSGTFTNGFDMVVQLTEAAIAEGLEMLPLGGAFPLVVRRQVTLPVQFLDPVLGSRTVQVPYDTVLELERPSVQLDSAANRVTVRCELGPSSQLATPPVIAPLALLAQVPLNGRIEFSCPVSLGSAVSPWPDTPSVGTAILARLTDGTTSTSFTLSNVTLGTVGGTTPVTLTAATLQTALAGAFTDLDTRIGNLPLTSPIPLHSGPTPVQRLQDIAFRILPASAPTGRPAVGLGLLTEASSALGLAGNIGAMGPITDLTGGAVRIANAWLIQLVAETLEQSPGFAGVDLQVDPAVPNASFSGSVHVDPPDGDAFTLKEMTVDLEDGGVRIAGRGEMSGFCWSARFDFSMVLSFACDPVTGALTATTTPPVVNAESSIPWYCTIVVAAIIGIITGGLTNWIVGVITGLVVAIILASIDLELPDLPISTIPGLFNAFGGIPLPLPVGSPGMLIDTCVFDDLGVRGRLLYTDLSPRQAGGLRTGAPNTGFDLDAGTAGTVSGSAIDLAWMGTHLNAVNGCEIQVVSESLDRLTLSDLQALTYGSTTILASQIPAFVPPPPMPWPLRDLPPLTFAGPPLVFAARTSAARYAKCAVWRRATDNALFLSFETYATPALSLALEAFCEETSREIVDQGEEACFDFDLDTVRPSDLVDAVATRFANSPASGPAPRSFAIVSRRGHLHDFERPPLAGIDLGEIVRPRHPCAGDTVVHGDSFALWVSVERAQRIRVRALPTLFAAPLSFRWTVFGTTLPAGSGQIVLGEVEVEYDDTSPVLVLAADRGVDVVGQVCVLVTDAAGRKCAKCLKLDRPGVIRLGGCHPCPEPRTLHGFLRVAGKLDRWTSGSTTAALRLRGMAARVEVPAAPAPVPLREALEKAPPRRTVAAEGRTTRTRRRPERERAVKTPRRGR